ncbi:hypothetical protein FE257_012890 [Aspergillus nanangensis]|uniref:Cell wall mannoprotein 1 n=1 Tax=Aspergillus nanangensis TaxID=2582783 RepID=A0AAD4CFG1_ASPNN|nr:hypothetical protein FE257_012890 [Aspergillus nanangensis]
MKFFETVFALGLVATSFAEPIPHEKRSLSQYTAVISSISAQVAVVNTATNNYIAGTVAGSVVQTASNQLVTVINTGTTNVGTYAALNTLDALALISPIQTLAGDVGDLVDDVITAKPKFVTDGLDDDVLASLQQQKTASTALATAISAKVPAALQSTAQQLAAQVTAEIQRGIDAYS